MKPTPGVLTQPRTPHAPSVFFRSGRAPRAHEGLGGGAASGPRPRQGPMARQTSALRPPGAGAAMGAQLFDPATTGPVRINVAPTARNREPATTLVAPLQRKAPARRRRAKPQSSRFHSVCWYQTSNKWMAQIYVQGVRMCVPPATFRSCLHALLLLPTRAACAPLIRSLLSDDADMWATFPTSWKQPGPPTSHVRSATSPRRTRTSWPKQSSIPGSLLRSGPLTAAVAQARRWRAGARVPRRLAKATRRSSRKKRAICNGRSADSETTGTRVSTSGPRKSATPAKTCEYSRRLAQRGRTISGLARLSRRPPRARPLSKRVSCFSSPPLPPAPQVSWVVQHRRGRCPSRRRGPRGERAPSSGQCCGARARHPDRQTQNHHHERLPWCVLV